MELSRFSSLAGILYFLMAMKSWKRVSGIIFLILLSSFLADNFNYFFIRLIYPNSFIIGNLWYLLNFILSIFLFSKILDNRNFILGALTAVFSVGALISFLFFYKFTESNTFTTLASNICFVVIALITFFDLLKKPNLRLSKNPVFWIATSLFIYNSLILLQNVFNNYLLFDIKISGEGYTWIHIIRIFANAIKHFMLFYALILIDKGFPDSLKTEKAP